MRELACTDEHDPPFCGQLAGDLVGLVGYRGNDVSHQDVAVSALAQVSRLAFLSPSSPLDLSPDRLTWVCL